MPCCARWKPRIDQISATTAAQHGARSASRSWTPCSCGDADKHDNSLPRRNTADQMKFLVCFSKTPVSKKSPEGVTAFGAFKNAAIAARSEEHTSELQS